MQRYNRDKDIISEARAQYRREVGIHLTREAGIIGRSI